MPNLKSGAEVKLEGLRAGLGFNANVMPWPIMAGQMSAPDIETNDTLRPVPREEANLEAEKDEIAMVPNSGGIPDTYKIGGKRHYEGGTPLNLPDDSFIFSDTAKMRIKDPAVYSQFGMAFKKAGYTPAEIAKKYNINEYKRVLLDPNTDDLQRDTAELMIANFNLKLAKLGLLQESMKGFPQGIPAISMPYVESMGINPEELVQMNPGAGDDETSESDMTAAYGGILNKLSTRKNGGDFDNYGLNKYQTRGAVQTMPSESTQSMIPSSIKRKMIEEKNKDPEYIRANKQIEQDAIERRLLQQMEEDQIVADRKARIAESIAAQDEDLFGNPNWRDVLYRETQAIGDKFRFSPKPNIFDDYINPFVQIGDMATGLGQAPYEAQMSNSYIPYATAIAAPLLAGRMEAASSINPFGKQFWTGNTSNARFINNIINPLNIVPGYSNLEQRAINKIRGFQKGGEKEEEGFWSQVGDVANTYLNPINNPLISLAAGTTFLGAQGLIDLYEAATAGSKSVKSKTTEIKERVKGTHTPSKIGQSAANQALTEAEILRQDELAGGQGAAKGRAYQDAKTKEAKLAKDKKIYSEGVKDLKTRATTLKNDLAQAEKVVKDKEKYLQNLEATGTTDAKILNSAKNDLANSRAKVVKVKNDYDTAVKTTESSKLDAKNKAAEHKLVKKEVQALEGTLDDAGRIIATPIDEKAKQLLISSGVELNDNNLRIAKKALEAGEKHAAMSGASKLGTKYVAGKTARQEAREIAGSATGTKEAFKRLNRARTLTGLGVLGAGALAYSLFHKDEERESKLTSRADENLNKAGQPTTKQVDPTVSQLQKKGFKAEAKGNGIYKVSGKVNGKDSVMYFNKATGQYAPAFVNGRPVLPQNAFNAPAPAPANSQAEVAPVPVQQKQAASANVNSSKQDLTDTGVRRIKKYGGAIDDYFEYGGQFQNGGQKNIKYYEYSESKDRIRPVYEDDTIGDFEDIENELPEEKYNELKKLYEEAEKEAAGNPNKFSPKTLEFQKKYHEYLPSRARKIISADTQRTREGNLKGYKQYDLRSNEEGKFGRRTKQYLADLDKIKPTKAEAKKDEKPATITTQVADEQEEPFDNTLYATKLGDLKRASTDAPWWLQDIIKTADAAGDYLTVPQYNPWQATAAVKLPKTVFYDPARELAASAEQQNIAAQALGQFAPPQQFNARMSAIQGEGAKQAANILGTYNKLNVELANRQEEQNAQFMNQAAALRAAEQTGLYDKYTIAKQQFDNARMQAKNRLVNQYVQGITNKAYTQALNSIYPQFAVDPSTGGMAIFHDPRSLRPSYSQPKTYQDYVKAAVRANPQLAKASAADINKAVELMVKMETGNSISDPYEDYQKGRKSVPMYNDQSSQEQ